jgi:hypothetical protein
MERTFICGPGHCTERLRGVVTFAAPAGWATIRVEGAGRFHAPARWALSKGDRVEFEPGESVNERNRHALAHNVVRIVEAGL